MPRILSTILLSLVIAAASAPPLAFAQDPAPAAPLRVFLECAECDPAQVATEISYVEWLQDREAADVAVTARAVAAAGGARAYELEFTGAGVHLGRADVLTYVAAPEESPAATGLGLRRMVTLGLMRYLANTPLASRVQIGLPSVAASAATRPAAQTRDPWNAWTFTVGGSGSMSGESSSSTRNLSANFSGNRTTADWKLNFRGSGSTSRRSISYTIAGRDTTSITTTESTSGNVLVVRSVGGHTSVGMRATAGTSTVNNTRFYFNLAPAVEYNVFPYSESTRRSLVVNYSAGMMSQKYAEETIYFRMEETRLVHSGNVSYSTSTSWGSASLSLDGSQYLHNTELYSLGSYGSLSLRLIAGLSLSLSGSYSRVRNQITLPRRQATQEEVLLRQRNLATNFRYSTSMSLSYRFGSSVQNVVNPRFGGGGGGVVVFFD